MEPWNEMDDEMAEHSTAIGRHVRTLYTGMGASNWLCNGAQWKEFNVNWQDMAEVRSTAKTNMQISRTSHANEAYESFGPDLDYFRRTQKLVSMNSLDIGV
ncbi:hypothetical protein EVAR_100329_1 [Eumeta japonica]|uniref:Uncharacterized protein n=1 Tax=Eumeta variegata TaxID=151549 RepID=A0A4C2AA59_EUMVA|nr:hypothetical protein EVAR_100329_1 [Eumeta japonica]